MAKMKADYAMTKARAGLIMLNPFFGTLALHLELVQIDDESFVNTMAVDGHHLFYHPPFVDSLTEPQCQGVIAHEVMHCAFQHMSRRQSRHPVIWNCAGDYVINAELKKAGFTLPEPHLFDQKYDGLSTEAVYELIRQDVEKQLQKLMKNSGGNDGKKGDGKGPQGQGGVIDLGRCGGVLDAGLPHEKAKADQVGREWEQTVRMAVNIAKNQNAGKVPGFLERLVKQLKAPKVSWKDLTRQFIDQSMTKDYSWSRPNRRFLGQNIILPGHVPDSLHHMVFANDMSGSVSHEMSVAMVSEMAGALNDNVADKLTVIYFDTKVRHVDEFMPGDLVTCRVVAGGGTDFVDPFEWVIKNTPDASCMVFLTDMEPCHWNLPEPNMPVLWGAYTSEPRLVEVSKQVPFGQIVHVESPWD